jgi:hypothetical protein
MKFSFLPEDIVHHVLSYNDAIKYRNGKYMNQISKTDKRYVSLRTIPEICQHKLYPYVYFVDIQRHVSYDRISKETFTGLFVDFENNEIIYSFVYDTENDPEKYDLWIRN